MADRKRRDDQRSTEDILREMEELSQSINSAVSDISGGEAPEASHAAPRRRGAMKSLLDFFVSVEPEEGGAGGSEPAAAPGGGPPAEAAPGSAKAPRVADLVAGEERPRFEQPEGGADEDLSTRPLEEIYSEAGLGDAQCSVDELAKLMENPAIASQPMSVKVVAVNLALSAKGVAADVPIADAVRRDRALDAYQEMLDERARSAEERNAARIQELTREAEEYLKRKQAEMEALRAETAEAKRQAVDFALRREAEEKRLAGLISPFLQGKPSPVTVGGQGGEQTGEP
jgi:hypothetical protein